MARVLPQFTALHFKVIMNVTVTELLDKTSRHHHRKYILPY